jgi:hypothetical protein
MVHRSNPHPLGSHEHRRWVAWHEAYLMQPTWALLYDSENYLRGLIRRFTTRTNQLDDPDLTHQFRQLLLELEAEADLLEQIAEHAHIEVVIHRDR